ncbi:DNA topoisomerase (ATP-hydrolyzing) [Sulfidibacter corallicola]|uniref:DNA topoisomerase (ATP-hydrolyzing) n=1 Tax=Sulfidibacter corallicola TaxID=2818388 RepID=A0A8A4TRJ6_SULCO|nr:DNA topoisomerase IV subunit B [Sulfidibacter corallicola]QTD51638.1 type IIA DNA topoisomerase subunit B [Sulfidibacter corallicola]
MTSSKPVYDESKIKSLSSLEHIRLRPGMYIGRLGDGSHAEDGIYILIKEVVDNAIDEFIMGHGQRIEIDTDAEGRVSIRDYGRGIPLGKVVECVSRINTGAKYNDDVFQFSVGLNGVGTKAVNALSDNFTVRSVREGKFKEAFFEHGVLKRERDGASDEENGTFVSFEVDREVFPNGVRIKEEFLRKRIQYYSYLNKGLTLKLNGETFYSRRGLKDLLVAEVGDEVLYEPIYYRDKSIEFAFSHTTSYGENFFSFVNGQYTNDGGTHLSAFREAILKAINVYSKKSFQGQDVRDGIAGCIAVKVKDPVFESQTKNKLSNTDIRQGIINTVKTVIVDFLHKNEELAKKILDKVTFNEKIRKELQAVKKEAREKARKVAIKIPGLRDCKYHFGDRSKHGDKSQIFLTEGQSALGSMVSCRSAETQALFALRGKPLNVFGLKKDALYKNAELYNIMKALDIEDTLENLRYNQVILATDADVDGLHIRNLLITFFLHYFEELVTHGHLYILETPLYRVRNKKETHYCYTDGERDKALAKLKDPELTRFKGLGEISPKEFGAFMGDDMRLVQVTVDHHADIKTTLRFYMGNNTPERKTYIMDNLI